MKKRIDFQKWIFIILFLEIKKKKKCNDDNQNVKCCTVYAIHYRNIYNNTAYTSVK